MKLLQAKMWVETCYLTLLGDLCSVRSLGCEAEDGAQRPRWRPGPRHNRDQTPAGVQVERPGIGSVTDLRWAPPTVWPRGSIPSSSLQQYMLRTQTETVHDSDDKDSK